MRRTFIKKEGVVITTLARYLLGEKCGNRLKTIDELATECRSSVGLTQAALKTLESSGAIRIERRGRNGSYLVEMDNKALLSHVDINNVVCAMPLPYTRLYEGLASGLKAQFASGWIAPALPAIRYPAALFLHHGDCASVHSPYVSSPSFLAHCAPADGTLFPVR